MLGMWGFMVIALVAAVVGNTLADVSHLPNHYLPPMASIMEMQSAGGSGNGGNGGNGGNVGNAGLGGVRQMVSTSIEQQELRELPTQTEYLRPGQQPYGIGNAVEVNGNGNADQKNNVKMIPLSMLMPQEMLSAAMEQSLSEQEPQLQSTPSAELRKPAMQYLPPQQQENAAPAAMPVLMEYMQPPPAPNPEPVMSKPLPATRQYSMPGMPSQAAPMAKEMVAPLAASEPAPAAMPIPTPTPARQYLPPHLAQPTYQQYQAQLMQSPKTQAQPTAASAPKALAMTLPMPVEFVQQQRQRMQYVYVPPTTVDSNMEALRKLAPTEASPAHFLAADGYHYRNGNAAAAADRRFRALH